MKKIVALVITVCMAFTVCACNSATQNYSEGDVIVEEVVVDENESQISKPQDTTGSGNTTSEQQSSNSSETNTSSANKPIEIDYNTVVEVDICGDIVRGYLDAKDASNQYYWLSNYATKNTRYDNQQITLDWKIDLSSEYTVYFSESSDFSNAITIKTNASRDVKVANLIPCKTYYWKAVGTVSSDALGGGKIKIKDAPVRWIYVDGIRNVRDMGGWTTQSGKKVKYGMLYRGAQLNAKKDDGTIVQNLKSNGLEIFNGLGIKTEFDLRTSSDVGVPAEGINLNYVSVADHTAYHNILSKSSKDIVVSNYKTMFNYLSDKSNYPIYTHCQGGADRTGTYAFLINGLLGVSYEDLTRDFELTSFAGTPRWRSAGNGNTFSKNDSKFTDGSVTVSWYDLYDGMMEYGSKNGCSTLSESIEHWLINYIGVPKLQIDSFKSIMLE